jgi:pyridoxine 4-dehydrogenase
MLVHLCWLDPGCMEPRHHALGPATVSRIGFGAMQLTGPGVFGPPRDRGEALAVLRRAAELGVDHIDTAQFYGPDVANELIRAALYPYPDGLALVSKVGARRDASGGVLRYDQPAQLRQGIEDNLRSLAVDHLAVVNLRLMEDVRPGQRFDDQLAAMMKARDDGLIGGIGLSNVSRDHLRRALAVTDIACVQNLMNLADRRSMPVLEECQARGIAFVPFFPLGSGFARSNPVLASSPVTDTAARLGRTPAQVALAWLLDLGPEVLLIPGTSSIRHLEENMAVADIELDTQARDLLASSTPTPTGWQIVSKVAVRPDDSGAVLPFGDPDELREGIEDNLRSLRAGQLAAVNLRLPGDGSVGARFDDQLAAMVAARDEGLIAGVGL